MILMDLIIFSVATLGVALYECLISKREVSGIESEIIIRDLKNNQNKRYPRRLNTVNIHNLSIF